MASIPGVQLSITGASGSQAALTPKSGWFAYVFPRGAWASQDSTGTVITFDSSDIASRFAANNWIQVGTNTANIRQVSAVGGNSISVGSAITVTEDNRVFIVGNTQPSVSGGSATYIIPSTIIRHRDDDGSDQFTNSLVTSNNDGLVQFYATHGIYDVLLQDGNQANQGYIADLTIGIAEGISTSLASVFGATVTINAALGVTGWATFGQTATFNAAIGITGWATFGSTVTMNAAAGVTGTLTVGQTLTAHAAFGVTGSATFSGAALFGVTATVNGSLGVTGTLTVGATATITGQLLHSRIADSGASTYGISGISLSAGWGVGATASVNSVGTAQHGAIVVVSGTTTFGSSAVAVLTFPTAFASPGPDTVATRTHAGDQFTIPVLISAVGTTFVNFKFMGEPTASTTYAWNFVAMSRTG